MRNRDEPISAPAGTASLLSRETTSLQAALAGERAPSAAQSSLLQSVEVPCCARHHPPLLLAPPLRLRRRPDRRLDPQAGRSEPGAPRRRLHGRATVTGESRALGEWEGARNNDLIRRLSQCPLVLSP